MITAMSAWYAVKAGAVFAAILVIVLATVRANHPFARFGPANQVTTLRAALVALVAGLVGERNLPAAGTGAAATSLIVTALDGVDGWLARRGRMTSGFGARFDMEVDALLVLVLSLLAWQYGKAGGWILLAGLLRYLFVAAGWILPFLRRETPPSLRAKTICVLQIVGLSVVILPIVTPPWSTWLAAALLTVLAYSFLVDVRWLWQHRSG